VAKIPAEVIGVPPASSVKPLKKLAGTVNGPSATGAALPI
jgi:hypothetical protein